MIPQITNSPSSNKITKIPSYQNYQINLKIINYQLFPQFQQWWPWVPTRGAGGGSSFPSLEFSEWLIIGNPAVSGDEVGRKMMLVTWGVEPTWKCAQTPAKSTAAKTGLGHEFSSFNRRRSSHFPATRTAGLWWLASKLQIGTKLGRWGGRNHEIRAGQCRGSGRVGFAGQKRVNSLSLSLAPPLSPFLKIQLPLFPYIKPDFFFLFFHLSLIQIKLIPDPWRK